MAVDAETRANRVKAVRYLARYTGRQAFGYIYDPQSKAYCAIGVLGLGLDIDAARRDPFGPDGYAAIDKALGSNTTFIEQLNDSLKMSFGHIAEELMDKWGIETGEIYP